jgi:hypothetical protein
MVLVYIYFIDSESECIITSGSILVLADLTSLVEGDWEGQQRQKSKAKGKIKIVGVIPESFSQDYVTNEKVKRACKGLLPNIQRLFLELQSDQDKAALADFVNDCYDQENVAPKKNASPSNLASRKYTSLENLA